MDKQGVIRVGGRLHNANLAEAAKHPIILHQKSRIVVLLLNDLHRRYFHASARVMLAIVAERFYISGLRSLARKVVHECVPCRRIDASPCTQQMGVLPADRVRPASPFLNIGLDFAGPIMVKRGYTRKPVYEKAYVCVFVCTVTKAVHLELVSDLSTEAILAAFRRFVNRRGRPKNVYSDNGRNFVDAQRELKTDFSSPTAKCKILAACQPEQIGWHFIPVQSPHQGGLWEAGVREMKRSLKKIIGGHRLRSDDLVTVLTDVEAILNSCPITPFEALEEDGSVALTPGHFLIGRPLLSIPSNTPDSNIHGLARWNLVKRLIHDLQQKWVKEYLQLHHQRSKWHHPTVNLRVGDLGGIREVAMDRHRLPLGRVVKVYPGSDGLVRVVDVYDGTSTCRQAVQRLTLILADDSNQASPSSKDSVLASLLGSMFKPKMSTNHFHLIKRTLSLVSIHNRCKRLFPACRQNAVFILFNALLIYFSYPFFL